MTAEIHVGDIGTVFKVTILDENGAVVDISSATVTKNIYFLKPDGTILTKAAVFYTNGTDGILKYVSIAGDLDLPGLWKIQAYVVLTAGNWKSSLGDFQVYGNIV